MAKFRPLHDRLLVQRLDGEEKSRGGIIIPDTAKEKPQQGRVLAVGPGRRDENGELVPLDVRSGDKVMFAKYAGTEIQIDGEDRVILREEDVLAIVE
ncbi:MAG TPA: co-chaperone GroES [Myxococcota bacterium]|jgi:chaperonin GroES|nr:co-chaperone GroES [Myxococcota bacterium]